MKTKAILHPAFAWDCEDCGSENFERAILWERSADEMQELRDDHGLEAWHEGQFLVAPTTVTCAACGHVFEALDSRAEDEEDE